MKAILLAVLVGIVGCVPGTGTGAQFPDTPASEEMSTPIQTEDNSPRLVTPIDGSSTGPVLATPFGGMYLPVDGGPPIMAI